MALTISSPGVEIREIDLTLNASLATGTKVLVHGFASQGPAQALLNITSQAELDEIYFGSNGPTNPAEDYFYYTCKEILNSPATLLTTRLPYGSGDGTGYQGAYVALAYPTTGYNTIPGYAPANVQVSVSNSLIEDFETDVYPSIAGTLIHSNINPASSLIFTISGIGVSSNMVGVLSSGTNNYFTGSANVNTGAWTLTSNIGNITAGTKIYASYIYTTTGNTLTGYDRVITDFSLSSAFEIGQPSVVPLTEAQYENIKIGVDWNNSNGVVSSYDTLGNAAFFVVNDSKMILNDKYEGYYIAITDNNTIALTDYTAIQSVNTLKNNSTLMNLSTSILGFTLTGTVNSNNRNMSEIVETSFTYDFSDSTYDNALVMYLFRLKTSQYADDPNILYYTGVEKYVGQFDVAATIPKSGGGLTTFSLENNISDNSNYIKMFTNKYISTKATVKQVRTGFNTLNPIGSFTPCKSTDDSLKYVGAVSSKIEKALGLAENVLNLDVDIVLDAGLSTIWAYSHVNYGEANGKLFDDTAPMFADIEALLDVNTGDASDLALAHKLIFNTYNNFCQNTRKDCMFISDPIRGIFVQGKNNKTLDSKSRNFSQHVYNPLINLYNTSNSNYAAVYANWVQTYDATDNTYSWLPISGYQAAIMARMDATYYPWWAPFGLNNGIIRNITNIALRPNQKQCDMLYKKGINPVVFFQGDGFVVWGQKTLQTKPSAFDRINVRRLFLVLERSTMKIMRYFIGEPNTTFTQTRVINTIDPIFAFSKNNSGVYDYKLICNATNNGPAVVDNNQMNVDIYLKPVKTAEFILISFYAVPTGADFTEYTG